MKREFSTAAFNGATPDLASMLELERLDENRFRTRYNQPNAYSGIFGGQLLAHGLAAADQTVGPDRTVHSLHAYFLRVGDAQQPLDFAVERVRDGARFSSRRVCATQNDKLLFTMDCSYRVQMGGVDHQQPSSHPLTPVEALNLMDLDDTAEGGVISIRGWAGTYPIEIRVPSRTGFSQTASKPRRHYWLRAPGAAKTDDPAVHRQILAFMSDLLFSGVPLSMHTTALPGPHIFVASLDHSIWFHRPVRCDDWLLFETDSPSANGSVNLSRGVIYGRDGALVASLAQEALQTIT